MPTVLGEKKNMIQLAVVGHFTMTSATCTKSATCWHVSSLMSSNTLGSTASAPTPTVFFFFQKKSCPVICQNPSLDRFLLSSSHGLEVFLQALSILPLPIPSSTFSSQLVALGMSFDYLNTSSTRRGVCPTFLHVFFEFVMC